jgi:methylated-DNA-protein-cysteine methyltransferase-like protein
VSELYEKIYRIVKLIPKGRVMSYAGVARQAGIAHAPRVPGYALYALRDTAKHRAVPWWRVINSQGRISNSASPDAPDIQRELLRAEGVAVREEYRVDMRVYDAENVVYEKLKRSKKPFAPSAED